MFNFFDDSYEREFFISPSISVRKSKFSGKKYFVLRWGYWGVLIGK